MEINKDPQPAQKEWTPDQKWAFLYGTLIQKVLAPEGYKFVKALGNKPVSNITYLSQERIGDAIGAALQAHAEYKQDLTLQLQAMLADVRSRTIFDPGRAAAISTLEKVIKLIPQISPSRVGVTKKDDAEQQL